MTIRAAVTQTAIDCTINMILRESMNRYGVDQAYRDIALLTWYINTGRASVEFLRNLIESKAYLIARRLHKGGSDDEVLARLREYFHAE